MKNKLEVYIYILKLQCIKLIYKSHVMLHDNPQNVLPQTHPSVEGHLI